MNFAAELAKYVSVEEAVAKTLETHFLLMLRWNGKLNLTRIVDFGIAVRRHYAESLQVLDLIRDETRIVDLGSGAGFPGIPVGVGRSSLSVVLLENDVRKSVFLKEATRLIPNVKVSALRGSQYTEPTDLVISRAVKWQDLADLGGRLGCDVIWVSSAKEVNASIGSGSTWNIVSSKALPGEDGLIVRLRRST